MLRIRVYQIFQCFIRKLIEDIKRLVFRSNDRLKDDLLTMFDRAMSFVKDSKIEGDYLEFGSYKGSTIIIAFHAAQRRYLSSINFYAFDSFEGLPEITGLDSEKYKRYDKGQYRCDVNSFKKNLSKNGVDLNRVATIPGYYNESLTEELKKKLPIKKASIIHVDCDLYESTVPVLHFIESYVQDGTVVMFDDWFSYKGRQDMGEARAFREWILNNPSIRAVEYFNYTKTGKSFLLSIK